MKRPATGTSIAGGGETILEYVNAGRVAPEQVRAEPRKRVAHLTYAVQEW